MMEECVMRELVKKQKLLLGNVIVKHMSVDQDVTIVPQVFTFIDALKINFFALLYQHMINSNPRKSLF